jgi:polysaccharide deacetylase family protein (PEP-CTERM system associated)
VLYSGLANGMKNTYLFSIDLEDVRFGMADGLRYKERVPANVHKYFDWLNKHNFKCTFFIVGDVAETYPSLIKEISTEGHELACHMHRHVPLDKLSRETFKAGLEANVEALLRAGAPDPNGFRAPIFSLMASTSWAYDVLRELGFSYSSSVLPAKNPFYGWEEFGRRPKKIQGIVEIPMTVRKFGPLSVPIAGGVYFRVLPNFLVRRSVRSYLKTDVPLLGYFHPYDIDTDQERFMHPEINDSRFYNFLMYYNRKNVFRRLDRIIEMEFTICPYAEYIRTHARAIGEGSDGA